MLPGWNLGAGLGFVAYDSSAVLLAGSTTTSAMGISTSPRITVLLERRVGEQTFLTFQVFAAYRASQDDTNKDLFSRQLTLEGTVGLRRVFNPGGVIEVSWFGSAGVSYGDTEWRSLISSYDPLTGGNTVMTLQTVRVHSFSVGALTGLTLERELVSGLALRLSSSILGLNYGLTRNRLTLGDTSTDRQGHGVELGLRFSPSIELRYAF
ncbi:MAG: hypothetical protein Q8L48_21345 [Archangium sp.]|nr:hypothetical protein [Archangium sp.]